MPRLKIRLLGSFHASLDTVPITQFESNLVSALLAYLVVERHTAHDREKLAELFWPGAPARRACSNLNQGLYNLRLLLGDHLAQPPYFLRTRDTVQFNPESDYWLDVQAFSECLAVGNLVDHQQKAPRPGFEERLQEAVRLYRGDFLEGLSFDSSPAFDHWALVVRLRLQRQVLGALHLLADHYAERKNYAQALTYAWRQVELDPLGEPAVRQLMALLAADHQRSQALVQFERLRALLAEELDVSPEPETIALRDRIRREARQPARSREMRSRLLPSLTPLIGRQRELLQVYEQIASPSCRLLTILGPGGSGKTRLALEIARSVQQRDLDGAFYIPLHALSSPVSIPAALFEALGLPRRDQCSLFDQLVDHLKDQHLLLLLDGMEHLQEAAGWLVEILRQAPGIKMLVTSRTRLNVKGEQVYRLAGLQFADGTAADADILASDAVQLLLAGLRRVRPEYTPAPADLCHLLSICRHVQGMPLNILLASSWGAKLSVREIAEQVSQDLDFFAVDRSDVPARQQSWRATLDHTWKLLDERLQRVFASLAVFRGAFTRQAASLVSEASPQELHALVEHALLTNISPGWYGLQETVRQYGREKLAASTWLERQVCSRHSDYYLQQLAYWGEQLSCAQHAAAMSLIELEQANIRAAWDWAAGQFAVERLHPVIDALCRYYDLSLRYEEGISACRSASQGFSLERGRSTCGLHRVCLLLWQSRFHRLLGEAVSAGHLLEAAQSLLAKSRLVGDDTCKVDAFLALEQAENHFASDRLVAEGYYQRSLAMYRRIEDAWGMARASAGLSLVARDGAGLGVAV